MMELPLTDPSAAEPSRRAGFSGNRIDRYSEHRSEEDFARAMADPAARFLLAHAGRICVKSSQRGLSADHSLAEARELGADLDQAVLLGRDDGVPVLMAELAGPAEALPSGSEAIELRSIYMHGLLPPDRLGAIAQGVSLLNWNRGSRYCGRCGSPTRSREGGYRRVCENCGASHFPRTDPVVIMLATRGEFCLLGRNPHFRTGMYSCLAGFLEPGETIEDAVRRETREEAGISIGRVTYHASQPWPFPHTLMIGCYAEALTRELVIDRKELEDCRWFSREEVRAMLAGDGDGLALPPRAAIATLLVEDWARG